jgi:hypothetical protein
MSMKGVVLVLLAWCLALQIQCLALLHHAGQERLVSDKRWGMLCSKLAPKQEPQPESDWQPPELEREHSCGEH